MKRLMAKECKNCEIRLPADSSDFCPKCGSLMYYIWEEERYRYENAGRVYEGIITQRKDGMGLFIGKRVNGTEEIAQWVDIKALEKVK